MLLVSFISWLFYKLNLTDIMTANNYNAGTFVNNFILVSKLNDYERYHVKNAKGIRAKKDDPGKCQTS